MNWHETKDELSPLGTRVLCYVPDSNLWDGNVKTHFFLYSRELLSKFSDRGNHILDYEYVCENRGRQFGHKVTHWAELTAPESTVIPTVPDTDS
jgi:hypothetical protein